MIKRRPDELLVQLFHIYAEGAHRHTDSRDDMFLPDKTHLWKFFDLPVISGDLPYPLLCPPAHTHLLLFVFLYGSVRWECYISYPCADYELSSMREMVGDASALIAHGERVTRPMFRTMLLNNRPLVKYWADLMWKQLPTGARSLPFVMCACVTVLLLLLLLEPDLRLQGLDEIEYEVIVAREAKIQEYLWRKVYYLQFHAVPRPDTCPAVPSCRPWPTRRTTLTASCLRAGFGCVPAQPW